MYNPFVVQLTLLALSISVNAFPAPQEDARHEENCYEDNPLRTLENHPVAANSFCPGYLAANGSEQPPQGLGNFQPWEYSSACSCYAKTASGISSAAPAGTSGPTGSVTLPIGTAPIVTAPLTAASTTSSGAAKSSIVAASTGAVASSPAVTSSNPLASTTGAGGSVGAGSPAGPIKPGSNGKRGIAYNYKSQNGWSAYFKGSPYAVWGSNWDDSRGSALDSSFTYVPTVAVDGSLNNANWLMYIPALIKSGTTTLFASNEPDNAGQANLNVGDCATVYRKYMQPFAGQAALGTPAVTNGGGTSGLAYLDSFATSCSDCVFNFINVHFYLQRSDVNTVQFSQALKNHIDVNVPAIQAKHDNLKGLPIMIGEFWLTGASDPEGENLMLDLLPYLDGNDKIMGYQAFGGLWEGNFIKTDGSGLSPAAQRYNTYSAPPSMTSSL